MLVAAALLVGSTVHAADRAAAEAAFTRAERAAKEMSFAEALAAYREVLAADPSAPFARVARARVNDLAAHAEGDFRPLARLEALRRDPKKLADRAEVEALARDVEAFPEGRVRAEARLLLAEAWSKLGEPERAIQALEAAAADGAADRLTRSLALSELWTLRRARREIREMQAALDRDPSLSPALVKEVHRVARRVLLRDAAIAVLAALALVGVGSLAQLARKARDVRDVPGLVVRPLGVAFSLYLGGAGAVIVHLHGDGDPRPFLWLGLGVLALDVIARAFVRASGTHARGMRAAWAAACLAGVIAAAFLAVERTEVSYLEGLGL